MFTSASSILICDPADFSLRALSIYDLLFIGGKDCGSRAQDISSFYFTYFGNPLLIQSISGV